MAVDISASGTGSASATTSHGVTLDAGTADKLIMMGFTANPGTVTPPSGFTTVASGNTSFGGNVIYGVLMTKAATSDTSVTVTTANSVTSRHLWRMVTGGDISTATVPTAVAASGHPNPPATGTMSSGDYLVDALATTTPNRTVSSYPTNYADDNLSSTTASPSVMGASRSLTSITAEDPGQFTISGAAVYVAFTIAIPVSGGGTDATATPATVGAVAGIPTPTVTASVEKAVTSVPVVGAVPQAAALADSAASPSPVDVVSDVPTPTVTGGTTASPDPVDVVGGVPQAAALADSTAVVSTVDAPAAVPTPTVTGGGDDTATPSPVDVTGGVPQATPIADVTTSPGTVNIVGGVPTPTVVASVEKLLASIAVVSEIPLPALSADVNIAVGTVNVVVDIPLVTLLSGAALDITALVVYQFHRINSRLVLSPIGRSARVGFATGEGFERASDPIQIDQHPDGEATTDYAMTTVAAAWAANSGASIATLKAAIHSALDGAGFRAADGTQLP